MSDKTRLRITSAHTSIDRVVDAETWDGVPAAWHHTAELEFECVGSVHDLARLLMEMPDALAEVKMSVREPRVNSEQVFATAVMQYASDQHEGEGGA